MIFFIFIFVNVMLKIIEFCICKPPVTESTNPNVHMYKEFSEMQ